MEVILDLYNFDSPDADGSKYVLTSPRSLEACSRLKVKPVQLLHKSQDEFSHENSGKPIKLIEVIKKIFCYWTFFFYLLAYYLFSLIYSYDKIGFNKKGDFQLNGDNSRYKTLFWY